MNIEHGLKLAAELKGMGDARVVAVAGIETLKTYNHAFKAYGFAEALREIGNKGRLVIGLRYSEFLANTTDPEDLVLAEVKRIALLARLGITAEEMNEAWAEFGYV